MHVSAIRIYPIKSTHRVELQEAVVERAGIRGDRRWMLVDDGGDFITQREEPRLALVQASLADGGLDVAAPDMPPLTLRPPADEARVTRVRIWKDRVEADDAGAEAADWFTRYLGRPVRAVHMGKPDARRVDEDYAVSSDDHVSFADGYPLLLASSSSLADLNSRLDEPVPMTRFRPNLVVSGAEPFAEDGWRRIRIGEVVFHVVKGCARCVITTIDQETAAQGKEPLRTLNQFRNRDGNVYFGQNLIPNGEGMVRLGDSVEVG